MSRLKIWNEQNIKNKISICIKKENVGSSFAKELFSFPLSDILFSLFKDHIEKAIGNNIANQPLTYILIYGNAKNSEDAWSEYENYIHRELYHDFEGGVLKETSILELEEAFYFFKDFK